MKSGKEQFYLRRISKLETQVAQLIGQNAELMKQNAELVEQNAKLTEQVGTLTEQVAALSKNSSNSSKPPSSDIVKPPKPKNPKGPRRQGGQPGHKGVTRPPFRPDQINHFKECHPSACPHGHTVASEPIGKPKIQQVAELCDNPLIITEHRIWGHFCPICNKVIWADLPAGVIEGCLFGPRLHALIGYMKGSLHASYSALEAFCSDVLDINVSRSHLCNTITRLSNAIAGPYEELQEHIPTEPVLNVDESGWKDNGDKYWIWTFCASLVSFFVIAKTRSSKVLEEILGKTYSGTIVSDFFSVYVKYANTLQQFCLAHLIRDIKFLTTLPGEVDKLFGDQLLIEFKRLFHFWHLREKIPKDRLDRLMFRIKDRVLVMAQVRAGGEKSKSRTLARRFNKHGEAIFRFLFDPAIPPTNNAAERSIRGPVIDRRITQGSRSPRGREWNARIWTVLGTCRKQGRSSWQFLQNALSAHYFQTPTPSLLPPLQ